MGMITSCDKEDSGSTAVQLLNFGPTGAKHGDTLRFFGHNLHKVTSVEFSGPGASVAQSAFIQQTSELIMLKVPVEAEKGFVTLKTPEGDIVSKTQFNLNVAFKVTTMTLQARPGENITLTGDFMNWVRRVTFENILKRNNYRIPLPFGIIWWIPYIVIIVLSIQGQVYYDPVR